MKILPFFFILLSIALCAPAYGQKTKKPTKIKTLKLNKKSALKFYNGLKIEGFSVDKDGFLLPDKGYEIIILEKTKEFLVKPIATTYQVSDNVIIIDIEDGSKMVCACGFGEGDDCSVNISQVGGNHIHKCVGSCACGSYFIEPIFNVAQYETMDGN